MKYKWLNKDNKTKLIVFFNGWGMDESIAEHLQYGDYDLLMFYDYNTLHTDFDFSVLTGYEKRYLVAWSMGVMTASLFNIQYDSGTAINGTLKPIDDKYGIPKNIYNLTLNNFNSKSAERFVNNMFLEKKHNFKIRRDFENIKTELQALTNYEANLDFQYDKIILSSKDKIIPTKNQSAFWGVEPNIESGHAPFLNFKSWEELL